MIAGALRRTLAVVALASAACGGEVTLHLLAGLGQDAGAPDAAPIITPTAESAHENADDALAALFLDYLPTINDPTTYDGALGMYWEAVFDATDRRGTNAFPGTAQMFFELQQTRGWTSASYEDEGAIAIALLHGYATAQNAEYLTAAKAIYADLTSARDTTCCGTHPGGIWSTRSPADGGVGSDKTAVANLRAVIAGAELYAATGDTSYELVAEEILQYWLSYMVAPDGHVFDRVRADGSVDSTSSFTYDQGYFIGALLEVDRALGQKSHIVLAETAAQYLLGNDAIDAAVGPILGDSPCSATSGAFKGVAARYLGELFAEDPSHTEYRAALVRVAQAAFTLDRDPASGEIACDWAASFDASVADPKSLGSAAVALAAAAEALGPGTQRLALTYEAEEGDLHGIGVGHDRPGFKGWGYVVGFGIDGQAVDIPVRVPAAGSYAIVLRYASPGDAIRTVSVNGTLAASSVAFPNTGGYENYRTVQAVVPLQVGANQITIAYAAGVGSTGYLNLDEIVLSSK